MSEEQVTHIAGLVARRMGAGEAVGHPTLSPGRPVEAGAVFTAPAPSPQAPMARPASHSLFNGLFPDVDQAVEAATDAFRRLSVESLELRGKIIDSVRESLLDEAESLAVIACEETGLGRVDDKIRKNRLALLKTPGVEALAPKALSGDRGLTLFEPAPFGVIGAITPVTNPSSTLICNAVGMLAAGNSVVFNVHPSARKAGCRTVQIINRAVTAAGGPQNLVTAVADPTIESAQALMHHPGVRLLVVTGGAGVVREAMQSGKRAVCAGPGNPPVVVDETADLEQAGRDIVLGASFDNNIVCVDEKEVFVTAGAADGLIDSMKRQGGFFLTAGQMRRLENVVFEEMRGPGLPAVVNKDLIGRDAAVILSHIGIDAGTDVRLAFAEVSADHPLVWTEQMMPLLPIVRVESAEHAIDMAVRAERGNGHSAVMHSHHLGRLSRMAREMNTSIFVKNGPCYAGLGEGGEGHCSLTIASPTGEGLTGPLSFSRERRCVVVDHFRIV